MGRPGTGEDYWPRAGTVRPPCSGEAAGQQARSPPPSAGHLLDLLGAPQIPPRLLPRAHIMSLRSVLLYIRDRDCLQSSVSKAVFVIRIVWWNFQSEQRHTLVRLHRRYFNSSLWVVLRSKPQPEIQTNVLTDYFACTKTLTGAGVQSWFLFSALMKM